MRKLTLCFLGVFFFISPQLFARGIREGAGFYNNRGLEYLNNGDNDLAIEDFSRAIRMEPDNANFYYYRGDAYFNKGQYNPAIEDYTRAILLGLHYAVVFYNRGLAYYWIGDYERAIEDYTRTILLEPNVSIAYNNRGLAYSDTGEYDPAIEDYTQAILLDPDNVNAYYNRGLAWHYGKGSYEQAIEDYTRTILLNPDNVNAYYYRGLAWHYGKNDYEQAIEDYTHAILLEPNASNAYYYRGLARHYGKGEYDPAIEDYTRTILLNPDNVNAYYNRGRAYYGKGGYEQAIEDYTHAILLEPNASNAYYYRGLAYFDTSDYERAIEDYTHTILLDPNNVNAYNDRGNAYYYKGEYNLAIENLTRAILLDPDLAIAYNNRGLAYSDTGEYDLAIGDLTHAILLDPNLAIAYNNRGLAYSGKDEYDRAIEDYSQAILLDPNYANAYYNRGLAYYHKGDYDIAIENFTHTILLDPDFALAYCNRGVAYTDKGEYDLAIENLTRAILLDPDLANAYNSRGLAHSGKGEYDLAIEDLTYAILLDPNYAIAYNNRGLAYSDTGEYDLAIEDLTHAILLDPNFAFAYNNRGLAHSGKGEYDLAIEDHTQAILLDPNNATAYNNRGLAYSIINEYDLAIEDYTQTILLDPDLAVAYSNRGLAYSDIGEYDLAIEDHTQAILLDPNYAAAYNNRGNAYLFINEYALAVADYEKTLQAAEIAANLNEIFPFTMNFANILYTLYPYLNEEDEPILEEEGDTALVTLIMDGISRSVGRAEQVRSTLGARGSAIMTQALYFYYIGLDLEAHFGTPEKGFEYSESLRSRGFLDQIGTEAALRLPGIGNEERERMRYLLDEIENSQNVLNKFRERPPQNSEEERSFVSAGQTLSVLEAELAALDTEISLRIPQYAELRNPVPASLAQAQDWLDDDTAVLIYALWDDSIDFRPYTGTYTLRFARPTVNSYCLVLTKDGLTAVTLDHDFNYMQAINNLRDEINHRNRERRTGLMEPIRNDLYNALIKPVLPSIPDNIKNLVIVPDGTLGHLPFDILREDYDSPELGETYRLTLSPSISVSMLLEKSTPQNLPILAFGGAWYNRDRTAAERGEQRSAVFGNEPKQLAWLDLSGSEAEVRMLEQLVASAADIRIFMGSDVSEEQIKRLSAEGELARYPMLHFATHGYFKEDDLERAGIVLSEVSGLLDNEEDGYLTIPEIAVLNLNARMVLLSACETGLGVLKRGDGMVGMVRAFLLAGAEYLGVSLWEVNDEATMEFMTRLYGKVLNEGITFKEAYYLVKNEFRRHNIWNHPYYWSAFVLYE